MLVRKLKKKIVKAQVRINKVKMLFQVSEMISPHCDLHTLSPFSPLPDKFVIVVGRLPLLSIFSFPH
jgi:hypothetical protein